MSAEILVDEIDPEAAQNFTKVTDLEEERTVLRLYHKTLVHILKHFEAKTTLQQDLELLCSEELSDWKMRFVLIYRSERKKIIHSQLHLISWLEHVLAVCDQSPSCEEFPYYYRFVTFKKTEFEEQLHAAEGFSDKQRTKYEEDYFLRRIFAKDYLKAVYELIETKL